MMMTIALIGCGTREPVAPPGPPPAQVVQVNRTGEPVDLVSVLVAGHVTVVDFWAEWCAGCKVVDERLLTAIRGDAGVVVRKIDIGDGETAVARQHKVGPLPHVRVFDRRGRLRYVLAGNDALTVGDIAKQLALEP